MCDWFSCVVTKDGYIHYTSREERLRLNARGENADHHSQILHDANLSEYDVDKIEYNPITKVLKLDRANGQNLYRTRMWSDAWFTKDEILETLTSMSLSEMLPKGVSFDAALYKKLLKKERKAYSTLWEYQCQDEKLLWRGMQGMRESTRNMLWYTRLFLGLCLTWKGESPSRSRYRRRIVDKIKAL